MTAPASDSAESLPRVILKPRKALPFFSRHPWVFAGAIGKTTDNPAPGDEVALHAHSGEFIARGLFNPHSNIRVRLYSWDETASLDREFWSQRLDAALALRHDLFPQIASETAFRWVNSEADGLSGLTVDRYGDWLIVQFTSLALANRKELFAELLMEKLKPAGIWLRTERGIREEEALELQDGLLAGVEPPRPLFISENGVRFGLDVVEGQKTGFYLDQRENRAAAARYLKGHHILDMFCYGGGFGLTAVVYGGAADVLGIDVSQPAVHLATANAELNGVASQFRFETGDAFETMQALFESQERFDAVILDPPKMTRRRGSLARAMRGYHRLNRVAMDLIRPGGILISCSCSGLVDWNAFERMLAESALRAGRHLQLLERRGAAPDHPVSLYCRESDYLKCAICRVTD